MDLSVVVVTWNTRDLTLRCVESVLSHIRTTNFELIVVDNASTDGTASALRERFPDIRIIETGANLGGPVGFNVGMRAAASECLMLMQNDGYVADDVIDRMAEHMRAHPDIGMLGCELRFPDGRHQHTARRHMSIWHSLLEHFWLYKLLPRERRDGLLLDGYWPADREADADWLAAMQMVRADAFLRTGGFDPQFYGGGEESEWAARVSRAGYRIRYVPSLGVIYHVGSASWAQRWSPSEQMDIWHRAGVRSYAVQHGRLRAAVYRVAEGLGATVRWAVYSIANTRRPDEYYAAQARHFGTVRDAHLRRGHRAAGS